MPGFGSLSPSDDAEQELIGQYYDPMTGIPVGASRTGPPQPPKPPRTWMMEPDLLGSQRGERDVTAKSVENPYPEGSEEWHYFESKRPMVRRPGISPIAKTPDGGYTVVKPKIIDLATYMIGGPIPVGAVGESAQAGKIARAMTGKKPGVKPALLLDEPPKKRRSLARAAADEVAADQTADQPSDPTAVQTSGKPAVDWSRMNQPFGSIKSGRGEVVAGAGKPWEIREKDIDEGIGAGMAVSGGGLATKLLKPAAPKLIIPKKAPLYAPTAGESGIINAGVDNPAKTRIQTVASPRRMMFPGIYGNPRIIAEEAAARVSPEDPAMKRLFGVSRGDLWEMSQGRVGNQQPPVAPPGPRFRGSQAAEQIMTPRNTQRMLDIIGEGGKHEGLRHTDAWYNMDPAFGRMSQMFGPMDAIPRYGHLNSMTGMASPGSDVLAEIQRGTGAHWLEQQGRFGDFRKFAGIPEGDRPSTAGYPEDMRYIAGHLYHRGSHAGPMERYLEAGRQMQSPEPKVPLYVGASGVPETGFQTRGQVGDAHWSRGVGLSDTRKGPTDVQASFSMPEYHSTQPWWEQKVAHPSGLESVPAQARVWNILGPQTGVKSLLGAPKLEMLAIQIMEAAKRLKISPEAARDLVLAGKAGAGVLAAGAVGGFGSMAPREEERR